MYQVRDGKRVVPTCPECGCRLGSFEDTWYHFSARGELLPDKDARGCRCPLLLNGFDVIDPNGKFDNGNIVVV